MNYELSNGKIGVITTVYNNSKNIISCINTVKSQNIENIIHYIYNDGSSDDLDIIMNTFSEDPNVVYIKNEINNGIAFGRNVCLSCALKDDCQFIALLDSDDLWSTSHISENLPYLNDFDLIFSNPIIKNLNGELLYPNWFIPEDFDGTILQQSNFIWTSSVVAKASCFYNLRFDETLHYHDDWMMWLSIYNSGFKFFNKKRSSIIYFWHDKKIWNHDLSAEAKKITDNNLTEVKTVVIGFSYNERKLMPHFLNHYSTIADKIVIVEGNKEYDYAYLKYTYDFEVDIIEREKLDDLELTDLRNNYWKKFKNSFDYVIVVDIDEFLDITKSALQSFKQDNITIPRIVGYQMVSYNFPKSFSDVKTGYLDLLHLNKQVIFSTKLIDINYGVGCHICNPVGELNYSADVYNLLHFKYVGFQLFKEKSMKASNRLSDVNKKYNFGIHYYNDANMAEIEFNSLLARCNKVTNNLQSGPTFKKLLNWLIADNQEFEPLFDEIMVENFYGVTWDNIENRDVIDIGANLGFFSVMAAVLGANQIIAVEPVSSSFDSLNINIQKSYFKNIKSFKNIVSSISNEEINISADHESVFNGLYTESDIFETVKTVTLTDLLSYTNEKNVYLKMDCEGSEYDILLSATEEDMNKITTIGLEIHRDLHPIYKDDEVIYEKLREFGFKQQTCNRLGMWYGNTVFKESPYSVEIWSK